jgi:methionyl-tRNA synthetase
MTPEEAYAAHVVSLETFRVVGVCLQPFMPEMARRLLDTLAILSQKRSWDFARHDRGENHPKEIKEIVGIRHFS